MRKFFKKILPLSLIFVLLLSSVSYADVYVKGYYRSNGTYVKGYYRTSSNNTINDNYSTYPNINPYTGKQGTIMPTSYYSNYYSYPTYTAILRNSSTVLSKVSFPVYINDFNINNTTSKYYPTDINGIVYVPLTAEMIGAMKLQGGWDATNGLVLNSSSDSSTTLDFSNGSSTTVKTGSVTKPTFAVTVNGTNLNVTDTEYYPILMNDIVYIPLTSNVLSSLRLCGGWYDTFMALYSY